MRIKKPGNPKARCSYKNGKKYDRKVQKKMLNYRKMILQRTTRKWCLILNDKTRLTKSSRSITFLVQSHGRSSQFVVQKQQNPSRHWARTSLLIFQESQRRGWRITPIWYFQTPEVAAEGQAQFSCERIEDRQLARNGRQEVKFN